MIWRACLTVLALAACSETSGPTAQDIMPDDIQSGYVFLTAETQALQDDTFANPGYLWVDRGAALFNSETGVTQSCASCHSAGLTGVAATYPKVDPNTKKLHNLESRINQCRTQSQDAPSLDYESDALLSLTAYVANQSLGLPQAVETTGEAADYIEQGRAYFYTRRGQFNFSCAQCHNDSWGLKLRGDTISQGHGNGFPAYRLEWETLGSLQRRLRDCDTGVRAEPLPYGSETYKAVELYLAARAAGLPIESPAIRR
jgi:sulfur-oxidizing protein SoxA